MKCEIPPLFAALLRLIAAIAPACAGCLSTRPPGPAPLPAMSSPAIRPEEAYTIACPDLIEVQFANWPHLNVTAPVGADGTVELRSIGRVSVADATIADAAHRIAAQARLPLSDVVVRVVEHRSRQLFLFGQSAAQARAIAYRGPERVVELLVRTGGLPADAAPDVHIVRSQLSEGKAPEVLNVDLEAIRAGDPRTNYRVQPQDEIYVGVRPSSRLMQVMPPILKPMYFSLRGFVSPPPR